MILGEIGRVERTVQGLLDFSRPALSVWCSLDLADCIRAAVAATL